MAHYRHLLKEIITTRRAMAPNAAVSRSQDRCLKKLLNYQKIKIYGSLFNVLWLLCRILSVKRKMIHNFLNNQNQIYWPRL